MRKLFLLAISMAVAMTAMAQPLLVGHRGSLWGVENTSEAFINGAKKGYHYLETDVKVAGDGTFVLTHDDSSSRLGGSLTIASATIEQLKAETYTQTRSGVTYTGQICTLAEYLDICTEYNVKPVIELKWATGINNNDCSNIPRLISEIEAKGFRNTCIILTSMKPCLEYIRTNYPDVALQFLTGEYWENHFDWCVQWKIDVDIQAGYFTKATVTRYHEAGLKVNMWTANTTAAYRTYGNFGCDFITTDYLEPTELPDLNADVTFPPNLVDYPTKSGVAQGRYTVEEVAKVSLPGPLNGLKIKRAIINNAKWYVLAHDANNTPVLSIIDPVTGQEIKKMSTAGIEGGEILLNDIAFTADGVLVGCNTAIVPFAGGGDVWKIYKWASDDADPEVWVQVDTADKLGNWSNSYAGITFAVSGKENDLYVYVATRSSAGTTYRLAGIKVAGGVVGDSVYALDASSYTEELWGADFTMTVTPFSRNNLMIDGTKIAPIEYTFMWDGTRIPMTDYDTFKTDALNVKATGIQFIRYGAKVYAYAADCDDVPASASACLYDVTDGISAATEVSALCPESLGSDAITYMNTDIEYVDGDIYLYLFAQGEGMTVYKIAGTEDPSGNTGTPDFALELIWEKSNTEGNAPENIDGTNAQQGGAANGLFYVNNCVDKKIYIFNETGCLGSIDGGAGWGTACDDAGNIIVRDDKLTGTTHNFIIYPAGATVDNPGSPVTLEVTVPLEGQTNFISASGDVLNGYGNIYMFPNAQNAINIISMENGAVISTAASQEIALTGSTAGYVIPINNNTENWIYQVRASGFYMYNGGESESLLATRASTAAPARNSTGGGDYFTLSGHNILLHNCGANYKGGFAVRDMTTEEVITYVEPIGTLGYETGGNYSTFNWLFAEKIDAGSYYIYQYCPSNGMALYKFYDKNYSGVESLVADKPDVKVIVSPNPVVDFVSVSIADAISEVAIYNLSGSVVGTPVAIDGNSASIDMSGLPAGTYIVRVNESSAKILKK